MLRSHYVKKIWHARDDHRINSVAPRLVTRLYTLSLLTRTFLRGHRTCRHPKHWAKLGDLVPNQRFRLPAVGADLRSERYYISLWFLVRIVLGRTLAYDS